MTKIGELFYPELLHIVYDGNCKLCRRTVQLIRRFDLFGRIAYVNALEVQELKRHRLDWLDREAMLKDMHAVKARKIWKGYLAYRAIAWRIPILWPLVPFLYLPPVRCVGERIYRHVADSRTCPVPPGSN